jgi:hypothetical protein
MSGEFDARLGLSSRAAVGALNSTGSTENLHRKLMMTLRDSKEITQGQMKDQVEEMEKRNEWLAEANAAMGALRAARPADKEGTVDYSTITFKTAAGEEVAALDWLQANGIAAPVDPAAIAEAERAKAALDGHVQWIKDGAAAEKWGLEGWMHYYPSFVDRNGQTQRVDTWAKAQGYAGFDSDLGNNWGQWSEITGLQSVVDGHITKLTTFDQGEFDAVIQNLKGAMDTVNNNSQLDLMRYQGLNDMDGQLTEQMTTELKTQNQRSSSIIRNTGG